MKKLIINKGRERSLINRHPWIYSGAVKELPEAEIGEILAVYSFDNRLIGYGFYAPGTQIVCRVFEYTSTETDVNTQEYWTEKIKKAFEIRKKFIISEKTNAFRLINAEGDFFPGLIADVYDNTVVVQMLIKGTENIKDYIINGLLSVGYKYVYLKSKEVSGRLEGVETLKGWISEKEGKTEIEIIENGVKFIVDIETGQKTGFFLDQRDARQLIKQYSKDATVLNTFSYSGGFSLYALDAGAKLVHSVDSSKIAVDLIEQNLKINNIEPERHASFAEDVFKFLKTTETKYDVIVLDPPAFAKTAKAVKNAARGYKELNLIAFRKIKPGGIVFTFSCSQKIDRDLFRKIIFAAAADAKRNVRILHQTTQAPDHSINIYHPENEYLKGLVLLVE
ncbi:MAG: class I SAM-dependent rRNA methyltransferase [Bacteroidales bacterium]|nr:class I SAM-dependent rRNA methyltransferase [Bacteroidales bacterium]MBN2756327.1 class I SAM-dependent rRNA methyltransferase [Bacteroidales bacterium]